MPAPISFPRSTFFRVLLLLFVAGLTGYIWNVSPSLSPNDNARWDTIWSLMEFGTYQIFDTPEAAEEFDKPQQLPTIDKVMKDGKAYASKPPLFPTVIAAALAPARWALGEPFAKDRLIPGAPAVKGSIQIYSKIALILFNVVPFLMVLWLYERFLEQRRLTGEVWAYCLLAMSFGTLVTGYLVTLNNHTQAASFAFLAAILLLELNDRADKWTYLALGSALGWTAVNEFPAGALIILAFALAWWREPKLALWYFLPPILLFAIALFVTNYLAIGSLKPAYLQKHLYDYPGSYWTSGDQRSAIDALNDHPENLVVYLIHMTIGHHGLFSLTPVLLLAGWGWIREARDRESALQPLVAPIAITTAIVFLFYWIKNDQRNYGGFCHGMRWLFWFVPVWMLALPTAASAMFATARGRRWAWMLLAISTFSMADTLPNPWTRSWLHRILLWLGVVQY